LGMERAPKANSARCLIDAIIVASLLSHSSGGRGLTIPAIPGIRGEIQG
jgi:hypothetical protein